MYRKITEALLSLRLIQYASGLDLLVEGKGCDWLVDGQVFGWTIISPPEAVHHHPGFGLTLEKKIHLRPEGVNES